MSKLSTIRGFKGKRKWNIRQLFRATDFESLMYPCFIFCRILGVFPYKIDTLTIKLCKRCYILSTIIICVLCICHLMHLRDVNFSENIIFKNITRRLQCNCFFILSSFMAIATFILHKPRMRLIQTILELSLRLPPQSYLNLSRLIHAKDIFGFLYIIIQTLLYFNIKSNILPKISELYITLLLFQMDMIYMNCVCVLKACFKQVNDNLANLRDLVADGEPYILRGINHKQRNLFLLMELKALKKQHLAISDTVQMLNMIFSLQLLVTIVMTFLEATFMLYFYVMHWKIGVLVKNMSHQIYDLYLIKTMLFYSVKIVLIVWACETGKNQAKEINTTVHNVLNSIRDKQIKYELQLFSLQLMHRENIFWAKAVIVDATLLTAMVHGIVTYLLILIQFLFISNYCDGKPI